MSEPLQLLPPEIEAHPDFLLDCLHCGASLRLTLAELYRFATAHRGNLDTVERRVDALRHTRRRMACAFCKQAMDLELQPVVTWRVEAGLPDPKALQLDDGAIYGARELIKPHAPPVNLKVAPPPKDRP